MGLAGWSIARSSAARRTAVRWTAGSTIGLLLLAGSALAQTGAGSAPFPTQNFKAWNLDCLVPKSGPSAGTRVCFIHHEAKAAPDSKLVAARVVIRHNGPDRKLVLIVELPPNTVQASGATVAVDTGAARPVSIAGCIPQFCYGAIELTQELAAAAKAGHEMSLGFAAKDSGPQSVKIPLQGITAALAALEQTGS
jgi:invasion protein IalB